MAWLTCWMNLMLSVAGIAVLVESEYQEERLVDDYISLVKLRCGCKGKAN